jgi:hypothetical protein
MRRESTGVRHEQGGIRMRLPYKLAALTGALVAALAVTAVSLGVTRAAPSNTSLPSISGSARDGSILTASNGSWTNSPTSFTYQWLRCDADGGSCNPISGANSRQYTVQTADVGNRLRVTVTASNKDGSGTATSRPTGVVQATGSAPKNTSPPSISGTPQEDSTLTVNPGGWSGSPAPTFTYQWQRCAGTGGNCADIAGATGTSYKLTSADVAHTVRVNVTAKNSHGSTLATTPETALIAPAKAAAGGTAISVAQVSLPNRLVINGVQFSPNPIHTRSPIVARFHVSDTRGFAIQGALVYALGLPYGWTFTAAEVPTDGSGWATITLRPTVNMPVGRPGALVIFVRARKPGDNLLAGVSTRRLVQDRIR